MTCSPASLRLLCIATCLLAASAAVAQTATTPAPQQDMTPPPPPPPLPPPGYAPQTQPQYQQPYQPYPPQPSYQPQSPVLGPARLRAVPGQPPPAGYHVETENSSGLIIAGAVTFGVTYVVFNLFPGLVASSAGCAECGFLMIPVVGPTVLGIASGVSVQSGLVSLLVLDTIVQAGGMAMLIAGLAIQNPVWVRDYRPVAVLPILTPGMQGLSISGRF